VFGASGIGRILFLRHTVRSNTHRVSPLSLRSAVSKVGASLPGPLASVYPLPFLVLSPRTCALNNFNPPRFFNERKPRELLFPSGSFFFPATPLPSHHKGSKCSVSGPAFFPQPLYSYTRCLQVSPPCFFPLVIEACPPQWVFSLKVLLGARTVLPLHRVEPFRGTSSELPHDFLVHAFGLKASSCDRQSGGHPSSFFGLCGGR